MGYTKNVGVVNDIIRDAGLTDKDFVGISISGDEARLHLQWETFCRMFGGREAEVKVTETETVMGVYTHYNIRDNNGVVVWTGLRSGKHEGTVVPA